MLNTGLSGKGAVVTGAGARRAPVSPRCWPGRYRQGVHLQRGSGKALSSTVLFLLNNDAATFITGMTIPIGSGFSVCSGV